MLLIGSGPIVIGQAAEFDYSGTQACLALREEGIKVVLVNSNPATIQTDLDTADIVYVEPLHAKVLERIIEREKPDGVLATMAGQTGLNLAVQLREVFKKHGVAVLGTSIESIELAEDREQFKELIQKIDEPIPASKRVRTVEEALGAAKGIGYPVIVRADYCLGGTGSGIVANEAEMIGLIQVSLTASATNSALVERSVKGMAEIEYEVIRDSADNCITICNMENIDPIGVHTGESIVVAPAQTLSDDDHQKLRTSAIKIIRALKVEGACNIQFALDQSNGNYYIIEVNPRASRSSALASKATGYPIARVAAKIAAGYTLPEIENRVTGKTACFEPAIDYVVLKIPRWPFDKLRLKENLGTGMKSTGETMAIGRTFEESLMKAIRSLELRPGYEEQAKRLESLEPTELRLFKLKQLLRDGATVAELASATSINAWFLEKIRNIAMAEKAMISGSLDFNNPADLLHLKRLGFSDKKIGAYSGGRHPEQVRAAREKAGLRPVFKMVDTCAGEYEAVTPYFYSTYEPEDESPSAPVSKGGKKVIILGGGPIRMGQGIEFDYCTVHAVQALREAGFETVVINNNPETVSTDFDVSDKLYFEPLTPDDVLAVVRVEEEACKRQGKEFAGVIVQFGGQTAVNLAGPLEAAGVKILGTTVNSIDLSQDRKKFNSIMRKLGIPLVQSGVAYTREEAVEVAGYVGYPLLLRPSYVLGGRAMEVVANEKELLARIDEAIEVSRGKPVAIDHFVQDGIELDIDFIADGKRACIVGIMEQIEEAGIHSGDSACCLPTRRLTQKALATVRDYSQKLASTLNIVGLANIQMVVKGDEVTVLELNPRASRTVPFVSKATGVQVAKLAARIQAQGMTLDALGLPAELKTGMPAVKVPVFPFSRFSALDPKLGAEMKSTGETMGVAATFEEAYLKALLASGVSLGGTVVLCDCGKWTKVIAEKFKSAGVAVKSFATTKEAAEFLAAGNPASLLVSGVDSRSGASARLAAVAKGVHCVTSAFAAIAMAESVSVLSGRKAEELPLHSLNDIAGVGKA